MTGGVQGIAAQQYFKQFLTSLESGLGSLPDWRRTAFWRQSSFLQAWSRAKKASRRPEAVSTADLPHQYRSVPGTHAFKNMCGFNEAPLHVHACLCRSSASGDACHCIGSNSRPLQACVLPVRAEATWGRQPLLAPLARDKAASQQLEARSLLLAGQAGLCCNPQYAQTLRTKSHERCILCHLSAQGTVHSCGGPLNDNLCVAYSRAVSQSGKAESILCCMRGGVIAAGAPS